MEEKNILWKDRDFVRFLSLILHICATFLLIAGIIYFYSKFENVETNIFTLLVSISLISLFTIFDYTGSHRKIRKSYLKAAIILGSIFVVVYLMIKIIEKYFYQYLYSPYYTYAMAASLLVIFISETYKRARLKFCYITDKGIFMGNAYHKNQRDFLLKQKSHLIEWDKLKDVRFVDKQDDLGKFITINKYIFVKTYDGKTYNCRIKDHDGCEHSVRLVGKIKVLFKDFKFSKIIDSEYPEKEFEKLPESEQEDY